MNYSIESTKRTQILANQDKNNLIDDIVNCGYDLIKAEDITVQWGELRGNKVTVVVLAGTLEDDEFEDIEALGRVYGATIIPATGSFNSRSEALYIFQEV